MSNTKETSGSILYVLIGGAAFSECNLWAFSSPPSFASFLPLVHSHPLTAWSASPVSLPCHLLSLAAAHSPGSLSSGRALGTRQMERVWPAGSIAQCRTVTCIFTQRPCLPPPFCIHPSFQVSISMEKLAQGGEDISLSYHDTEEITVMINTFQ